MVRQLQEARAGLSRVAAAAAGIWADSDFNAQEIRELGIGPVQVVPLAFSLQSFKQPPEAGTMARFGGELKNILFVGRMVPNKCVDELILAFAWYHRRIEPRSRLILVGSDRSCPRYYAMLRMLAARLELPNVCFEGFQSDARLAASYERADVYVCTSRHEGYCLPLVEAMSHDVPVVARATGGMPETMGGAGVLFEDMDSRVLAELIHRVASDDSLRRRIRASQQRRLMEMGARDIRGELGALLKGWDS
jgi:glycosyltransferase involved in cell wall biosynthesis